ncbi:MULTISPECIES: hypothetical protein [Massilia]|uniref:Uncharacterized protein n=1 Tax=Massilia aurea TaxID=373040 RepID=A0A422QPC8_9BURK|nr:MULTISPECIES: hypothetical protein [Massilia]MDY0965260.1 hypothetical protein [Massilia sp. CFBP9026]RNF31837.1 hypothetical protein NM04_05160 [Massilia aurea]
MIDSIGGASVAQAAYAPSLKKNDEAAIASATTVTPPDADAPPPAPAQSAESVAAARLGDELNAQADAARVQRAVDAAPASATASSETSEAVEETASAQAPAAAPPAPAGGAAASSETTDTDYIAEADTNSDKTVSDEERAAYEAKLRDQNEKQAEVRAAYGQIDAAAPALDVTA